MDSFKNKDGKLVLLEMVKGIQVNKDYLGEIDGLIGDGDHGMNMNKGFTVFQARFEKREFSFTQGLYELCLLYTSRDRIAADRWRRPVQYRAEKTECAGYGLNTQSKERRKYAAKLFYRRNPCPGFSAER